MKLFSAKCVPSSSLKNLFTLVVWLLVILPLSFVTSQTTSKRDFQFSLDVNAIQRLSTAKYFNPITENRDAPTLSLPNPKGEFVTYKILRNEIMSQEMRTNYPDISTLTGYSDDHKNLLLHLVIHKNKLHGFLLSGEEKSIYIDLEETGTNNYISYYGERNQPFTCLNNDTEARAHQHTGSRTSTNGATLKTYDMAVVISDEYEASNGNGAAAIAAAVTIVSDMTAIYKRDLAVQFIATVRPETSAFDIVYPGGASANYAGTVVAAYFAIGEYDLGHVFHHSPSGGGSGQAQLSVVCSNSNTPPNKARAWSEANPSSGYGFLSIVAHEAAHQFSATHTFNSNHATNCNGNITASTSYEPGSGTTMMAYPGVCGFTSGHHNITDGSGNVIYESSPYFHVRSLEQMVAYINGSGNSCATPLTTGNNPPTANALSCSNATIPANTPFQLIGNHTDTNGDFITYTWEQYDSGPPHGAPNVNCGATAGPIFRSYSPSNSNIRNFPSLDYILNNSNVPPFTNIGECLSTAGRTLNFRLTVRDNNPLGGGIDVGAIQLTVNASVGPLSVTSPNTAVTYAAGTTQTVTWSGSNSSSICNSMNILLSIDGGLTFPYTLVSSTANDGTQSVTFPSNMPNTTKARIKIESNCNACVKFFDISNANFTVSNANCIASKSYICDISPITAIAGDPSLDLNPIPIFGSLLNTLSLTTGSTTGISSYNSTPSASGSGTCTSANFGFGQVAFTFMVDKTGSYSFTIPTANFNIVSIYLGTYSAGAPCTNYIGSNAWHVPPSSATFSSNLTLTFTTCTQYTLVLFTNASSTRTITISPPAGGSFYSYSSGASFPNNIYTYLAVNTSTNLVIAESSLADFTTLSGGNYCIYGLHYKSGGSTPPPVVVPSSFIGQNIDVVKNSNSCSVVSINCKPMTVNCTTVVTSQADTGSGSLRSIYSCVPAGTTITFNTAVADTAYLSQPLLFNKNVTINGNSVGVIDVDFTKPGFSSATYGLQVQSGVTVGLQTISINHKNNTLSKPVVLNNGLLQLTNASIRGNTDPVVTNAGAGQFQILGTTHIKKN